MIQEATQHYLGVACSRCKAPIPVSPKSAKLYEELQKETSEASHTAKPHAFALRCKSCAAESIYSVGAIQQFEGAPVARQSAITNRTLRKRRTRSTDRL
jgi:L-lactate utilization protein LutB